MKDRPWTKPKLLILTRNRPEESVLVNCKDGSDSGPSAYHRECYLKAGEGVCSGCALMMGS